MCRTVQFVVKIDADAASAVWKIQKQNAKYNKSLFSFKTLFLFVESIFFGRVRCYAFNEIKEQ